MQIKLLNKNIYYYSKGKGKPILLVHGWGGSSKSMQPLIKELSKNYTCYVLDLPGFGYSDNPEPNWGVDEYSELIKEFVNKVIGKEIIYCGHSFGGALGIHLSHNTNWVKKLILIAPAFKRTSSPKTSFSNNWFYIKIKRFLTPIRKLAYRIFYPHSQVLSHPHLEDNFKKIVTQDLTHMLKEINIETLVIWGEKDSFVNIQDAYVITREMENAELKVYSDAEHNLPFKFGKDVSEDIISFLDKK